MPVPQSSVGIVMAVTYVNHLRVLLVAASASEKSSRNSRSWTLVYAECSSTI